MQKGTIDIGASVYDNDLLVIDAELLFEIRKKWGKKSYELTHYNSKFIRYFTSLAERSLVDSIIIGVVTDYAYRSKIIEDILLLPYAIKEFHTEENYGRWMEIVSPALHFAVEKRKYYNKKSVIITEEFINQGEIPDK